MNNQTPTPDQPQVDHFILKPDTYIQIRRYLGQHPYDAAHQIISALEKLPAVTKDDVRARNIQLHDMQEEIRELKGEAESLRHLIPEDDGDYPVDADAPLAKSSGVE